jgi:transcription antitermination factor NusG
MTWIVLQVAPTRERTVGQQLAARGYTFAIPTLLVRRTRLETVRTLLFPGYVLAQADLTPDHWAPISFLAGVVRVLRRAGDHVPRTLPEGWVEMLQETEVEAPRARVDHLAPGAAVVVLSGPFAGLSAEVVLSARDRVSILLSALDHRHRLTVPRDMLAAV